MWCRDGSETAPGGLWRWRSSERKKIFNPAQYKPTGASTQEGKKKLTDQIASEWLHATHVEVQRAPAVSPLARWEGQEGHSIWARLTTASLRSVSLLVRVR